MTSQNDLRREAYTVRQACYVAGLGRTFLYEMMGTGKLPFRKAGRRRVILRHDLEAFLRALPGHPLVEGEA